MRLKIIGIPLVGLGIILSATSCSNALRGTYTVQKYEIISANQQGVSVSNIGTFTFKRNGSGEKSLDYSLLGAQKNDVTPFNWSQQEGRFVTINSDGSDFAKTWIVVENKRKLKVWKSTDGTDNVQILELVK